MYNGVHFSQTFFLTRECLDLVDRKNSYTHNYQQESSRHIHNDIKTRYDLLLTGEEKPSENMMKNRFKEEEKKAQDCKNARLLRPALQIRGWGEETSTVH